ncbi:MAG: hypothetical protein L0338_02930 [Acidobacteria bacterium]|nr:hypothetical protein [Acidobacteriota bacterium]
MFYFQQLFQTALNGIDSTNIMPTVLGIAGAILLLSFLFAAYQAFTSGGDVRLLAIAGIKYLILGLVFASYSTVFRDVNGMFNSVADFIYNSTGVGDVFSNWLNQLEQYWQANGNVSLWNLVTGLVSGVISSLLILSAFVIFPICYLIFTVFYAMYGSVLYVTGPFVLALLPISGLGQLARTYLVNMMVFQAWGLVYAIIQVLMSAVNLASINAVLSANGVVNSFVGSSQMILLAMTAILFSVSIALVPFIASRIVRGDVGSMMMTVLTALTTTASTVAAMAVGATQGAAAAGAAGGSASGASTAPTVASLGPPSAPSPPPMPGASTPGGGTLASGSAPSPSTSGASAPTTSAGSVAAPPSVSAPSLSTSPVVSAPRSVSRPGSFRGFNFAHAMAWHGGYWVGSVYKTLGRRA